MAAVRAGAPDEGRLQRQQVGRAARAPWWERYGLDFAALAGAGLVYWQASRNGYSLVLAPEGVPQVSGNWLVG